MNSQAVAPSLRNLLADTFSISPDEITPQLSVGDTDAWDSFGHLQAILAIEGEYGVQFDPQRIPDLTTVAMIQAALEEKGAAL